MRECNKSIELFSGYAVHTVHLSSTYFFQAVAVAVAAAAAAGVSARLLVHRPLQDVAQVQVEKVRVAQDSVELGLSRHLHQGGLTLIRGFFMGKSELLYIYIFFFLGSHSFFRWHSRQSPVQKRFQELGKKIGHNFSDT